MIMKYPISKLKVLYGVFTLASLTASSAFAQSDHTKGGGEVVNRNGYRELRDLLEQSNCEWRTGAEIMAQTPELKTVLGSIAKVDWYLANVLEREMRNLDWCLTGKLVRANTNDRDSVMTQVVLNTEQVAIRMLESSEVYLDTTIFKTLSNRSQAYLILHETLHSFLSVHESMRNQKLRSTVKALSLLGTRSDRNSLYLQLEKNGIDYPRATSLLEPIKNYILYVFGDEEQRSEILNSVESIESIIPSSDQLKRALPGLTYEDQDFLIGGGGTDAIRVACDLTDPNLSRLLPSFGTRTLLACFTGAASSSPELRKQIVQLPRFTAWYADLIQDLKGKKVEVRNLRLKVPSVVATLTASSDFGQWVDLTSLIGLDSFQWSNLNENGKAVYLYIKTLLEMHEHAQVQALLTNPEFNTAFSFQLIQTQLQTTTGAIPRELRMAQKLAKEIPQQFWNTFLGQIERELGADSRIFIERNLNRSVLGIE